jgi:hypothetical protein
MPKVYRITSKKDGFRRAGLSHPARAVDHPADSLTPEQLDALMAEPRLVVQELDLPDDPRPPLQLEGRADVDDPAAAPGEPEPAGDDKTDKPAKAGKSKADGE